MKNCLLPLLGLTSLIIAGCASTHEVPGVPSVYVDHAINPERDIAQSRTFALLPVPHPEWDETVNKVLGTEVFSLELVKSQLEAKGFQLADAEHADLLVGVRVIENPGKKQAVLGDPVADFAFAWEPMKTPYQTDATIREDMNRDDQIQLTNRNAIARAAAFGRGFFLVIEVYDRNSGELAWQGWARARKPGYFGNERAKLKIVSQILADFPN